VALDAFKLKKEDFAWEEIDKRPDCEQIQVGFSFQMIDYRLF
jgi:hypothetical protein